MTEIPQDNLSIFTNDARVALANLVEEHPSPRRVSLIEKTKIIDWLTDTPRGSLTQEEFSRRNYVRKNFIWDAEASRLLAVDKKDPHQTRMVVTTDEIVGIVQQVHQANGHPGWDATWRTVNKHYYGILRTDVILLLKSCCICAQDPKKRPKGLVQS